MTGEKLSPSKQLAAKVVFAALQILKEKGGEAPVREIIAAIEQRVPLDAWARATYEKSGSIRWQAILYFYSIECIKAGFLVKNKGTWYLTSEGEEALKLGETGLLKAVSDAYSKWATSNRLSPETTEVTINEEQNQEVTLHQIEQLAADGLRKQINQKNPYEFQELVAALLRGMGYFTPFVAPQGKDGGIDIIAYRDPLGTSSPRIKVQVKHRENPATVHEVRQLIGLLGKEGDVGIFVSTGGFTADAKAAARHAHVHVELIDIDRFISLWQEFYPKLTDEDKSKLPLLPIYFYAPRI